MDFVKVDEEVLLTRRDGEPTARRLVVANALGTDLRAWDRLVRYLFDRFHVVRYDMRGQGLSTLGDAPLDADRLARDLAALMDQLDTGPAVLVGAELGAMVALSLTHQRPELVQALVLVGGGCRLDTPRLWQERARRVGADGLAVVADETLDTWLPARFRAQRPDECRIWRNMFLRAPPAGYVAGCGALAAADATTAAAAVQVPALVLAGTALGAERRAAAAALADTIPGAERADLSDAALLAQVAQPAPLAATMMAFLESHGLE
jgi:3-oxoadipate enol-lactonase